MLRCKGIEGRPDRGVFRILNGEEPASLESLTQVARLANVLLQENQLAGEFVVIPDEAAVSLELLEAKRTFFHNGIVFAALDAFNDPVRNPTLTLRSQEDLET